jgi:hypothetical protein
MTTNRHDFEFAAAMVAGSFLILVADGIVDPYQHGTLRLAGFVLGWTAAVCWLIRSIKSRSIT